MWSITLTANFAELRLGKNGFRDLKGGETTANISLATGFIVVNTAYTKPVVQLISIAALTAVITHHFIES